VRDGCAFPYNLPIFREFAVRPNSPRYISDATRFLEDLKAQHPHLEASQRAGRALLWDRDSIDPDQSRRLNDSRVPQKAYPYQTKT
jgi:hypothetical protein